MLRAVLIATSMAVAMPCFAQQVRVINGDIEHLYGPDGQLLDDADLQARNQRAWEPMQAANQPAIGATSTLHMAERAGNVGSVHVYPGCRAVSALVLLQHAEADQVIARLVGPLRP